MRVLPENGRRILFVNSGFTQRILGIPQAESDEFARVFSKKQLPEDIPVLTLQPVDLNNGKIGLISLIVRAQKRQLLPRRTPVLADGRSIAEAALGGKIGTAAPF